MISRLLRRFGYVRATPENVERAGDLGEQWRALFRQGYPMPGAGAQDMALRVSALGACVRLISGTEAKVPFPVYRRGASEDERERDREHPLDAILNRRANRWQTAYDFRRQLTSHVALHGNGYALIRRAGTEITALEPFPDPLRMTVEQKTPGEPPSYRYGTVPYRAEDVLHLRDLTVDGVVGLSRIEQARQGITLAWAAETYATASFLNGGDPGIAIKVPRTLNDAQRDEMLSAWTAARGGPGRAGKPVFLESGVDIMKVGASNRDSQFLELRAFQVEDIARLYGVPPHLIGLTEKQTSWGTGVEQMALGFLQFHMLDWYVMWETAVGLYCFNEFESDYFVEHKIEGLLRTDLKSRMEAYGQAIQNGILSPNEVRRRENEPPRTDGFGDRYVLPANMRYADEPAPDQALPRVAAPVWSRPRNAWRSSARQAMRLLNERDAA